MTEENQSKKLDFRFYDRVERPFLAVNRRICKFEVVGEENLPREGNFTFASNHLRYFDPPGLAALIILESGRRVSIGGKVELFQEPILGWVLKRPAPAPD